jgi:hypothetical protein
VHEAISLRRQIQVGHALSTSIDVAFDDVNPDVTLAVLGRPVEVQSVHAADFHQDIESGSEPSEHTQFLVKEVLYTSWQQARVDEPVSRAGRIKRLSRHC